MTDDPVDYELLEKMYREATMDGRKDPIVNYAVNEDGVVDYFTESGSWAGCSSLAALQSILNGSKGA